MISFDEAMKDGDYFEIDVFATDESIEGFFTNARVDRNTLPEGWYAYDLREGDDGDFCTIEKEVIVNHGGTFLTESEIDLGPNNCLEIDADFEYSF